MKFRLFTLLFVFIFNTLSFAEAGDLRTCESVFEAPGIVTDAPSFDAAKMGRQTVRSILHKANGNADVFTDLVIRGITAFPSPVETGYHAALLSGLFEASHSFMLNSAQETRIRQTLRGLRRVGYKELEPARDSIYRHSKLLWSTTSTSADAQSKLRSYLKRIRSPFSTNEVAAEAARSLGEFIALSAPTNVLYARLLLIAISEQRFEPANAFYPALLASPRIDEVVQKNEILRWWVNEVLRPARSIPDFVLQKIRPLVPKVKSWSRSTDSKVAEYANELAAAVIRESGDSSYVFTDLVDFVLTTEPVPYSDTYYETLLSKLYQNSHDLQLTKQQEQQILDALNKIRDRDLQKSRLSVNAINRFSKSLWATAPHFARGERRLRTFLSRIDSSFKDADDARRNGHELSVFLKFVAESNAEPILAYGRLLYIVLTERTFSSQAFYDGLLDGYYESMFAKMSQTQQRLTTDGLRSATARLSAPALEKSAELDPALFVQLPVVMTKHMSRTRIPQTVLAVRTFLAETPTLNENSPYAIERANQLALLVTKKSGGAPELFSMLSNVAISEGLIKFPVEAQNAFLQSALEFIGKISTNPEVVGNLKTEFYDVVASAKLKEFLQNKSQSDSRGDDLARTVTTLAAGEPHRFAFLVSNVLNIKNLNRKTKESFLNSIFQFAQFIPLREADTQLITQNLFSNLLWGTTAFAPGAEAELRAYLTKTNFIFLTQTSAAKAGRDVVQFIEKLSHVPTSASERNLVKARLFYIFLTEKNIETHPENFESQLISTEYKTLLRDLDKNGRNRLKQAAASWNSRYRAKQALAPSPTVVAFYLERTNVVRAYLQKIDLNFKNTDEARLAGRRLSEFLETKSMINGGVDKDLYARLYSVAFGETTQRKNKIMTAFHMGMLSPYFRKSYSTLSGPAQANLRRDLKAIGLD